MMLCNHPMLVEMSLFLRQMASYYMLTSIGTDCKGVYVALLVKS